MSATAILASLSVALLAAQAADEEEAPIPDELQRPSGSPARTTIGEPTVPDDTRYFYLHNDNYFALHPTSGWPFQIKFQVSVRFEMVSFRDRHNISLSFAYTQKSFWDLFAFDRSSPFVESDYKPELFVSYRPQRTERFREVQLGVQHESDGLGNAGGFDQSANTRGWNALFADIRWALRRDTPRDETWFYVTPGARAWLPFVVFPDNIMKRIGYMSLFLDADIRSPRHPQFLRFSARAIFRQHNIEAMLYYPIPAKHTVRPWFFVQLFYGEAERLVTYEQNVTHLYAGIGFL